MCKINGKKLAEIRKENGMTQKQFAEALGVSKSAIQNYERERNEPTPENLKKICMLLKINQGEIEIHEIGYDFLRDEGKLTSAIRKKNGFVRYTSPEQTQACWKNIRSQKKKENSLMQWVNLSTILQMKLLKMLMQKQKIF